jgi:hypothetical protein
MKNKTESAFPLCTCILLEKNYELQKQEPCQAFLACFAASEI